MIVAALALELLLVRTGTLYYKPRWCCEDSVHRFQFVHVLPSMVDRACRPDRPVWLRVSSSVTVCLPSRKGHFFSAVQGKGAHALFVPPGIARSIYDRATRQESDALAEWEEAKRTKCDVIACTCTRARLHNRPLAGPRSPALSCVTYVRKSTIYKAIHRVHFFCQQSARTYSSNI